MKIKNIVLLSLAAMYLQGCASGGSAFSSKTTQENLIPLKKVFFLSSEKSRYFNKTLNSSFESSLKENLSTCGVDIIFMQYDKADLDFEEKLKISMASYEPEAVLTMKADGGNAVISDGGVSGTLYFHMSLSNFKSGKNIWKSKLAYQFLVGNMFTDDSASGSLFGDQLYNRLIFDKVFPNCKTKVKVK